ncbi:response regulator [Dolichospermum sp. UHCC 0259]|uniref:response regulator n=1 Tax=Dolichospermum sp. UHCC 0259 TaxID=2590010 RepID=UPI0014470285|nr:response regulator [Dolichospermum sp. UHCC 0259]MTJ48829.1 response regulator [Dolichospermum sp. UHCC 0259]
MSKLVILCVDDEEIVLRSLNTQLKEAFGNTYEYEMAQDADEALELIAELNKEGIKIIIIVSDWLMPGMKGDEFFIKVHQQFPETIKILLTGQADESAIQRAKEEANIHCCLYKPWSENDLLEIIKSSLDKL